MVNSFPPGQIVIILADDIFKWILLDENDIIPIQISLKFVSRSPINNKPALVQVMALHRTGDTPLHEPMLIQFTDPYMRHLGEIKALLRWHWKRTSRPFVTSSFSLNFAKKSCRSAKTPTTSFPQKNAYFLQHGTSLSSYHFNYGNSIKIMSIIKSDFSNRARQN